MSMIASSSRSVAPGVGRRLSKFASSSAMAPQTPLRSVNTPSARLAASSTTSRTQMRSATLSDSFAEALPSWLLPSQQQRQSRHFSTSNQRLRPRHASISTPTNSSSSSNGGSGSYSTTTTPPSSTSSSTKPDFAFPSHLRNPTPYDIFHFSSSPSHRNVSPAEVKARYYDLVRSCHPDRFPPSSSSVGKGKVKTKAEAEEEFKLVVSAYNLLKDPKSKRLYDRAGIGWDGPTSNGGQDPWRNFQDMRYTRRYNPSFSGAGHDRFGWQNQTFYSNQYNPHHPEFSSSNPFASPFGRGWNGRGQYTSNGIFISTLFVVTWVLAGLQYSRLSLQSQKAIERADKSHLNAAESLNKAREEARSEEGRERWRAFRRRAREQKFLDEIGGQRNSSRWSRLRCKSVGDRTTTPPNRSRECVWCRTRWTQRQTGCAGTVC